MKVYVDELRKCCVECQLECPYEDRCVDTITMNCSECIGRPNNCLLHSLSDYTKQVRKEVCEEIKQEVKTLIESKDFKLCNHEYANGYCYGLQYDLAKILDQIGEIKC